MPFCSHCGAEISEHAKFCAKCGSTVDYISEPTPTPVIPAASKPKVGIHVDPAGKDPEFATAAVSHETDHPKRLKWILTGAIPALAVAAAILLGSLFGLIPRVGGAKIEGNGFDTPEKAVEAYLTGLRDGDIGAMVSAFAIESYKENYDIEAYLERTHVYTVGNITTTLPIPNEGVFLTGLNAHMRESQIITGIYHSILNCAFPDASYPGTDGVIVDLRDSADLRKFLKKLNDTSGVEKLSKLKIEEVFDADDFADVSAVYSSSSMQEGIEKLEETAGGELADLLAVCDVGGGTYIFSCTAVRYNKSGKWYLYSFGGNFAALCGIGYDWTIGGLIDTEMLFENDGDYGGLSILEELIG